MPLPTPIPLLIHASKYIGFNASETERQTKNKDHSITQHIKESRDQVRKFRIQRMEGRKKKQGMFESRRGETVAAVCAHDRSLARGYPSKKERCQGICDPREEKSRAVKPKRTLVRPLGAPRSSSRERNGGMGVCNVKKRRDKCDAEERKTTLEETIRRKDEIEEKGEMPA